MDRKPERLEDLVASSGQKVRRGAHLPGDGDFHLDESKRKRSNQGDEQAQDAGQKALDDRFREELGDDIAIGPADSLQNADLPGPFGDIARHGLEGDENGNDDRDQRGCHGELVGQGKEAAEELQEGVRRADGRLFVDDGRKDRSQ